MCFIVRGIKFGICFAVGAAVKKIEEKKLEKQTLARLDYQSQSCYSDNAISDQEAHGDLGKDITRGDEKTWDLKEAEECFTTPPPYKQ